MNSKQSGFTAAEIIIATMSAVIVATLVYQQWQYTELSQRDTMRKTSINSIHYFLEEIYFKKNGYYPSTISLNDVKGIERDLLKDPAGHKIGNSASDLRYIPENCTGEKCTGYTLRANLEKEDDFIRTNS